MMTKEGLTKRRQTMIKKYGSKEAYRQAMRELASAGGRSTKTKPAGFLYMKVNGQEDKIRQAGQLGGMNSKRTKKVDLMTDEQFIDVYLRNDCSPSRVSRATGLSKQSVEQKAIRLRSAGVALPKPDYPQGARTTYDPERVEQLNRFVAGYDTSKNT